MPLRPEDVVRRSFTTSRLRPGYDVKEVDAFLDEVVDELKMMHARIDELEAAAVRARETDLDGDGERVRMERQQLELIRRERAALVEELRSLQSGLNARPTRAGDEDESGEPDAQLARQVEELRDEIGRLRQQHQDLKEQVMASATGLLRVVDAGDQQAREDMTPQVP